MSHSIIVLTSTDSVDPEVASKCLLEDATVALTVTTSSNSQNAVDVTPVVWKVLRFNANRAKQEKVLLDVTRRIARVTFGSLSNSDARELVIPFDSGAGLGPNQTIVFSDGRWSSSSLFGAPSEASFAINEETEPVTFSIGTRLNGRFEPMVLLPSLGEKEGVLFPYPYVLKAYLVPTSRTCVVGQILPSGITELPFHDEPSLDIRGLNADVAYRFYTASGGVPVLERAISRTLEVRLPSLSIPIQPEFAEALITPPSSALSFTFPASFGPPEFSHPLYTPPETPEYPIPSGLPSGIVTPEFQSALPTPTEESQVYV